MIYRFRQFTILIGDLAALYLGLYFALFLRYQDFSVLLELAQLVSSMSILFVTAIVIGYILGLYDLGRINDNSRLYAQKLTITALIWAITGIIYFYFNPPSNEITPKTILGLTALCGFSLIAVWRHLHKKFLSPVILKTTVVFVGLTPEAKELIKIINSEPERGFAVIGVVETNSSDSSINNFAGIPTVKDLSTLREKILQPINLIIIAPEVIKNEELLKELYRYLMRQTEMLDLAKFYEEITGRIPPFTFSESWFLTNLREQQKKIYDRFRILMDYFVAGIIGLLFGVTFPFIAVAIKISSPGPLFFKQERIGKNGKTFKIWKYRTMAALTEDGSAEIDGPKFAEVADKRITKVGKLMRCSRLDEIPQFVNIFKGEMGLIGPRPERPEFVNQLTAKMPFYELRHVVKPGITGWAQLRSGYYGTIDENLRKLEYDLYYIKNRSPFLDMIIILRTLKVLVRMIGR